MMVIHLYRQLDQMLELFVAASRSVCYIITLALAILRHTLAPSLVPIV
jgi:hypothetical protein